MSSMSLIPPNIVDYIVVKEKDVRTLRNIVVAHLSQQYIPYGDLMVVQDFVEGTVEVSNWYIQPMIKQGIPSQDTLAKIAQFMAGGQQQNSPASALQGALAQMMANMKTRQ